MTAKRQQQTTSHPADDAGLAGAAGASGAGGAPSFEAATIGAMMLDERAVDLAAKMGLTPAAFADPQCARASAAVFTLREVERLATRGAEAVGEARS